MFWIQMVHMKTWHQIDKEWYMLKVSIIMIIKQYMFWILYIPVIYCAQFYPWNLKHINIYWSAHYLGVQNMQPQIFTLKGHQPKVLVVHRSHVVTLEDIETKR